MEVKSKKKGLLTLFIISLVVLVIWVACALIIGLTHDINTLSTPTDVLGNCLRLAKRHVDGFVAGGILTLFNRGEYPAGTTVFTYVPIVEIVIGGLFIIAIIAGIILAIKSKHKRYMIYLLLFAAAGVLGMALVGMLTRSDYYGFYFYQLKETASDPTKYALARIAIFGMLVSGIVLFGIVIATYIVGLVAMSRDISLTKLGEETPIAEDIIEVPESEPVPEFATEAEAFENGVSEPAIDESELFIEEEPTIAEVEPSTDASENSAAASETPKNEEKKDDSISQSALASMLREVVRDIVRDEIARNNANQPVAPQPQNPGNQSITGATFGGPLVVQYFNGGINGVTPSGAPEVKTVPAPVLEETKKEEPEPEVKEESCAEPEPAPELEPAPVAEPVPAPVEVVPAPVEEKPEEPKEPKISVERIPFPERLLASDKELLNNYNEIKNEILSWGVKSRVSNAGDTFRLHKKTYIKLIVAGKSLKLYFALDPKDYADSTIPVQDAGNKNLYTEIPLVFKVKSSLSMRRCKQLIQDCMEKDGLEQGEIGTVNWVKELKAELAAEKKEK